MCRKCFGIGREIVFSKGRTITIRRRIACKSQLSGRAREVYNKDGQSDPTKTVAKRAKMQKNAQHVGNVATLCAKLRRQRTKSKGKSETSRDRGSRFLKMLIHEMQFLKGRPPTAKAERKGGQPSVAENEWRRVVAKERGLR